jgi:hypothetical protein
VIVRDRNSFLQNVPEHPNKLTIVEGSILDMPDTVLEDLVKNCDVIVSCLGHNITFKGIFGHPRRLVLEATKRLCALTKKVNPEKESKLILMGTVGVSNPDGSDNLRSWNERAILSVLRVCLPPHADNEDAASYLYNEEGENKNKSSSSCLKWVIVRPDGLVDGPVSDYDIFDKPQNALFGGAETSWSNVAHFMSCLIEDDEVWNKWQFQMPVPLNKKKLSG